MPLVNAGGNTGPPRTHLEADRPLQCSRLQNCWLPLWASESLQGGELDPGHRKCGFESSQNKWLGCSLWGVSFHPQSTKKLLTEGRESQTVILLAERKLRLATEGSRGSFML